MQRVASWLVVSTLLFLGCGFGSGSLSGTVTFEGKPLATGTVYAVGSDGVMLLSSINPDGTFSFPQLPSGTIKLGVISLKPEPVDPSVAGRAPLKAGPSAPPVDPSKWFEIPKKYEDPNSSGLSCTVSGATKHNIVLTK